MSNVLKVSLQTTIYSLANRGWSQRRIASELGINRETVGRYLRLAKPAIAITGVEEGAGAKPAISITGIGAGRRSQCEPLADIIAAKVEVGLTRFLHHVMICAKQRCTFVVVAKVLPIAG